VGNSPSQTLYLLAPERVANPKAKGVRTVSPFWNAARAEEPKTAECIDLECPTQAFTATLQVTAKVAAAKASGKKASGKTPQGNEEFKAGKGGPKVLFMVPYLTNIIAVQRGQALRASASDSIQLAEEF
jgi:hypothetical protein